MHKSVEPAAIVVVSTGIGAILLGFILFSFGILYSVAYGYVTGIEQNQGPLLAIFITGPLGVTFGTVAGLFWGLHLIAHPPSIANRIYRGIAIMVIGMSASIPFSFAVLELIDWLTKPYVLSCSLLIIVPLGCMVSFGWFGWYIASVTGPADLNAPLCRHCGYNLSGTPGDSCSECGNAIPREQQPALHRGGNAIRHQS